MDNLRYSIIENNELKEKTEKAFEFDKEKAALRQRQCLHFGRC